MMRRLSEGVAEETFDIVANATWALSDANYVGLHAQKLAANIAQMIHTRSQRSVVRFSRVL